MQRQCVALLGNASGTLSKSALEVACANILLTNQAVAGWSTLPCFEGSRRQTCCFERPKYCHIVPDVEVKGSMQTRKHNLSVDYKRRSHRDRTARDLNAQQVFSEPYLKLHVSLPGVGDEENRLSKAPLKSLSASVRTCKPALANGRSDPFSLFPRVVGVGGHSRPHAIAKEKPTISKYPAMRGVERRTHCQIPKVKLDLNPNST
jgi:hypothetical protein